MKDPEIHTPAEALQTFPTPAAAAAAVAGDFYPTLGSEAGNPNAGAQPMPAPILHTPTTSDPNAGTLPGN